MGAISQAKAGFRSEIVNNEATGKTSKGAHIIKSKTNVTNTYKPKYNAKLGDNDFQF